MSRNISHNGARGVSLAALMAAFLGFSLAARAGGHGEKIEFSEPSTPITTSATNLSENASPGLNRLNPTPSTFKQVQEDLFSPLKNSIQSVDSMQGVMTLPPPAPPASAPQTKRARELMEMRKNWAFSDLNDLYPEPSLEDALGMKSADADSPEKNPVSLIERYYNRLGQKTGTNRLSPLESAEMNAINPYSTTNAFTSQPFGAEKDPTKVLYSPKGIAIDDEKEVAPGFKDQNNFYPKISSEEMEASQKRTEEFKRLLTHDNSPVLVSVVPGNTPDPLGLRAATFGSINPPATLTPAATAHRSSISPVLDIVDPTSTALRNHAFDDPTAASLGLPNPLPQQPVVVQPTPAQVSLRMLDPYAATLSRPKF